MRTGTSSLMDGKNYTQKKVMRIDDINEIADEQIKQNVQKLIDKDIFNQAILAMEEMYGSGCHAEIDAYFRGAKWMQQELNKQV
jgi:predicted kinase